MNKGEFIHRVQNLTGIQERDRAENVTRAVIGTLCGRLTQNEARDLESQLAGGIDTMCRGSVLRDIMHRVTGPNRLDGDQFVQKVADQAHIENVEEAQRATRAVFTTLKEAISEGEAEDVADQLPKQLKVIWLES